MISFSYLSDQKGLYHLLRKKISLLSNLVCRIFHQAQLGSEQLLCQSTAVASFMANVCPQAPLVT